MSDPQQQWDVEISSYPEFSDKYKSRKTGIVVQQKPRGRIFRDGVQEIQVKQQQTGGTPEPLSLTIPQQPSAPSSKQLMSNVPVVARPVSKQGLLNLPQKPKQGTPPPSLRQKWANYVGINKEGVESHLRDISAGTKAAALMVGNTVTSLMEHKKEEREAANLTYAYFNHKIMEGRGNTTTWGEWFQQEMGNPLAVFSLLVMAGYLTVFFLYVKSLQMGKTSKKLKYAFEGMAGVMAAVLMMNIVKTAGSFNFMIVLFIILTIVMMAFLLVQSMSLTKNAKNTELYRAIAITSGLFGLAVIPLLFLVFSGFIQLTSYVTQVFDPFQNALAFSSMLILGVFVVLGVYYHYSKDESIPETKRQEHLTTMKYVGLGLVLTLLLLIGVVGFYYAYGKELTVKCIDYLTTESEYAAKIESREKKNPEPQKDSYFKFLNERQNTSGNTMAFLAGQGASVESVEEKVDGDRHLIESRLVMVKIICGVALILMAVWNHYTGWLKASTKNKVYFGGLIAFALLSGMLTAVFIVMLRSERAKISGNLRQNGGLIFMFGLLSGVFYVAMELSGMNTYMRDTATETAGTAITTTTTTTPEPTSSTDTFGDAQCKAMQSKAMYRMMIIVGVLTGFIAVFALFSLMSYSTGLSYVDMFFEQRDKVLGVHQVRKNTGETVLYQENRVYLFFEAVLFAVLMNLVYFLVLLAYNQKSDWFSAEFKEKMMELGLIFVKFFLFYYILVSLRAFKITEAPLPVARMQGIASAPMMAMVNP
jgi:hypothetical protein